jgi:predicted ATPase
MNKAFVRSVVLVRERVASFDIYPFNLPALRTMEELDLDPSVTLVVGENGAGKSTLVEAIAVAAGFNPEGGSRNFNFETKRTDSSLHEAIRLVRGVRRPSNGYFLRAESYYNVATEVERLGPEIQAAHGGNPHERSHGESFLALVKHRLSADGFYVFDEPEAALSPTGCLALLRRIHDLATGGAQFVIATHSPILMAYPGARIYELGNDGPVLRTFGELNHVTLSRDFLNRPDLFLGELLDDSGS